MAMMAEMNMEEIGEEGSEDDAVLAPLIPIMTLYCRC